MNRRIGVWPILLATILLGATDALAQREGVNIYGYFATRFEKTYSEPILDNGLILKETSVGAWSTPSLNVMMQHQIDSKFSAFLNLNGSGGGNLDVRNFWGEYSASRHLNLRLGKIYRRFGLYNELLDAVPTYYGIEPPELLDSDHLIVSRTTTLMAYGAADLSGGVVNYSLSTDNGEGSPFKDAFPVAYDLRYTGASGLYTLGTSGYSSFGPANSDVALGEGSPNSGVLPWMSEDKFWVFGGYSEVTYSNLTLQAEYWHANHDAVRDPESTASMIEAAAPNDAQMARMTIDPPEGGKADNINTNGDYVVDTYYFRAGYSIGSGVGEFGPYLQYDYYKNPETIAQTTYGGDNEAGAADDGKFIKWTLGMIYRPVPQVALKVDGSQHRYVLGGQNVSYPEMRFDVSYIF